MQLCNYPVWIKAWKIKGIKKQVCKKHHFEKATLYRNKEKLLLKKLIKRKAIFKIIYNNPKIIKLQNF
jgi:hypothetical protein